MPRLISVVVVVEEHLRLRQTAQMVALALSWYNILPDRPPALAEL